MGLIIFSNMMDEDCLSIAKTFPEDMKVVEITPHTQDWEEIVDEAISSEEDTIYFIGHGDIHGLYFPNIYKGDYLFHENNLDLVKAKNIICCWCYASTFCENHNIHNCFATSMFISNVQESTDNGIYSLNQENINDNTIKFYTEITELITKQVPLNEWTMILGARMNIENEVDTFNRQGLWYNE